MLRSVYRSQSSHKVTSYDGINKIYTLLENTLGGLSKLIETETRAEIIHSDDGFIHNDDLTRLMKNEVTGLLVKGFFDPKASRALGREISSKAQHWKSDNSQEMGRSDVATNENQLPDNVILASSDPDAGDDFFTKDIIEMEEPRLKEEGSRAGEQSLWPLDKLRLELDEAWPLGAELVRGANLRPFGGGLSRVLLDGPVRWRKGYIQLDELLPLHKGRGLFSANVYLQLPSEQQIGTQSTNDKNSTKTVPEQVLQLWPLGIRSRWDAYKNAPLLTGLRYQDPEAQIKLRSILGEPITIEVEPGDLVVHSAQRPYAAIGFHYGCRVSLQCFIQHSGPQERLLIDC